VIIPTQITGAHYMETIQLEVISDYNELRMQSLIHCNSHEA